MRIDIDARPDFAGREEDRRRLWKLGQERGSRGDHDARRIRRQRVEYASASGRHLQVRLKAPIRIDLRRRERQNLPLNNCRRGPFED